MSVKSFSYCLVTALAIMVGALVYTKPVAAMNATQKPTLHVETGACVDKGANEGTIGVDVTNDSPIAHTYKIIVNGEEKDVTVAGYSTEYTAFTELAAGTYTVTLIAPDDIVYTDSATITECHERELPTVAIETSKCVAVHDCSGSLSLSITNTNDYDVTYTVRVGHLKKDVFVGAHSSQSVMFNHLSAGDYHITLSGDDCTELCLKATIEQCPEEEPQPEQPGQGSGTPPPAEPEAPTTPATPVVAAVNTPATLPNTSAQESTPVATVNAQPAQTVTASSLFVLTTGLALVAYAAVRGARDNA